MHPKLVEVVVWLVAEVEVFSSLQPAWHTARHMLVDTVKHELVVLEDGSMA